MNKNILSIMGQTYGAIKLNSGYDKVTYRQWTYTLELQREPWGVIRATLRRLDKAVTYVFENMSDFKEHVL